MPDSLLTILKFLLVGLVYLFFFRVLRAVWAEVTTPRAVAEPAAARPVAADPARAQRPRGRSGRATAAPVAPGAAGPATRLQVVEPAEQRGRTYEVTDEVTVGRGDGCFVHLDDSYASQLHARLFPRDGLLTVEDLGSTNGTFVNGRQVSGPTPLRRGDKLRIGSTVLEVQR